MELITKDLSGETVLGHVKKLWTIQVKVSSAGKFIIKVAGTHAPDLPVRTFTDPLDAEIYAANWHGQAAEAIRKYAANN